MLFDGRRAVGVEFIQLGQRRVVRARREVVLAGGAVNSPQLLKLSGIGDRDELARHRIDVVADVPDVGQNLIDHLAVPMGFDVPNDTLTGAEKPLELVNYLIRRRGMLTSNVGEDRAALISGLQISARIAQSRALSGVLGRIARPLGAKGLNEETFEAAINACSQTLYHPVGTCRMGSDVVTPTPRVC